MRFMQISDLHLGKRLRERSMDDDQRYILGEIVRIAVDEKVDGLIVAGDVFDDGSSTTVEATNMLDTFLTELSEKGIETYLISGNHDNMDRLSYGKEFFGKRGIHIASRFEEEMEMYSRSKDGVIVDIYMLPFIKPVHARRMYPEEKIEDYTDAVRCAISHTEIVPGDRFRIMVTHQFVTSAGRDPEKSESEKIYVGNTERIDASVFDGFDYVALGHIHKRQDIGEKGNIHYCGAPLKYSVDEWDQVKSATIIDIDANGFTKRYVELRPKREVRKVTGPLEGIIRAAKEGPVSEDFVYAVLTDNPENPMDRLREVFPNIVGIEVPRTEEVEFNTSMDVEEGIDKVAVFADFYRRCTGTAPTENQMGIVSDILTGEGSE